MLAQRYMHSTRGNSQAMSLYSKDVCTARYSQQSGEAARLKRKSIPLPSPFDTIQPCCHVFIASEKTASSSPLIRLYCCHYCVWLFINAVKTACLLYQRFVVAVHIACSNKLLPAVTAQKAHFSLCSVKHQAVKAYGGVKIWLHVVIPWPQETTDLLQGQDSLPPGERACCRGYPLDGKTSSRVSVGTSCNRNAFIPWRKSRRSSYL